MPRKKKRPVSDAQKITDHIVKAAKTPTAPMAVTIACPQPRRKCAIRGTIRGVDGLPLGGVTVTLSGAASGQSVTHNEGTYSFGPYPGGGRYTIEVAKDWLQFTPPGATIDILNADATHDFKVESTVIHATVRPSKGAADPLFKAALRGATFSLDGNAQRGPVPLGPGGELVFPPVPRGGEYIVNAPGDDPAFSACRSIPITADRATQHANFGVPCFKISGSIKRLAMLTGASAARVTVVSTQGSATVAPNARTGDFAFPALPAGRDYTMSVRLDPFTFSPEQHVVESLKKDETLGYGLKIARLTGTCMNRGSLLPGATLTLSGAIHDLVERSRDRVKGKIGAGSFEFAAVPVGGDYVLTATHPKYVFTPDHYNLSAVDHDRTALDFDTNRHTVTLLLEGFDREDLRRPLSSAETGRVTVKLTGVPAIKVCEPVGAVAHTEAQFTSLPAEHNYEVTFTAPAYYAIMPRDPITGLTGLSRNLTLRYEAVRRTLTLTGTVKIGGVASPHHVVQLHDAGGTVLQSTTTDRHGQYTLNNVRGGSNLSVQPVRPDLATSQPWHRKFDFLDTDKGQLDFDFIEASQSADGGAYLAVGENRRLYLSPEARENVRGKRGADHEVPLQLLIQALKAKWSAPGTLEEGWKHVNVWTIPGPRDPALDWQTGFPKIRVVVKWNDDGSRSLVTAFFEA